MMSAVYIGRLLCECDHLSNVNVLLVFFRRRVRRLSVSVVIRRTLCAAAVDPRRITCRSPPAGSVATLPSARESVSIFICAGFGVTWHRFRFE